MRKLFLSAFYFFLFSCLVFAQEFSITPPSLNFGNVVVGQSSTLQTRVRNTGTSDLVISGITSSDIQFTYTPNTFPITITSGDSQVFSIQFSPTTTGLKTADITFVHNAA